MLPAPLTVGLILHPLLLSSAINININQGEDSNLGPSLGVARLAMMETGEFNQEQVMKKMLVT